MDALYFKAIAAFTIFFVGLVFGLIPLLAISRQQSRFLFYSEFFARGVFLGVGLIHFLPDALSHVEHVTPSFTYPVVFAVCAFTVFAIQFIEQGIIQLLKHRVHVTRTVPYLLTVLLSVHSVIEGAAVGVSDEWAQVLMVFIAVIAHKGGETFALGMNMLRHGIPPKLFKMMIGLFSLITPIGILLGVGLDINFDTQTNAAHLAEGVFEAVAAGTFLYIATFQHSECNINRELHSSLPEILFLGLGISVMALVALWV